MPVEIPVTGTSTPPPGVAEDNSNNTAGVDLLNATPAPNGLNGNPSNNGNHYGQTPKPERTKENGNNPPPKDNDEKPPKENNDKPPKEDNDKPLKDKNDQPPKDDKDKKPKTP